MRPGAISGAILLGLTVVAGCGGSDDHDMSSSGSGVAPAQLVQNGAYSDERFIDMMAAHHQMALEMARVEQQLGQRAELKEMTDEVIAAQEKEIAELGALRQANFGSGQMPMRMHPESMDNGGMTMPDQLGTQPDVDKAFIDAMIPHHAGAIQMAAVAEQRSSIARIRTMSREIITAQSREIGRMIELREAWYPSP